MKVNRLKSSCCDADLMLDERDGSLLCTSCWEPTDRSKSQRKGWMDRYHRHLLIGLSCARRGIAVPDLKDRFDSLHECYADFLEDFGQDRGVEQLLARADRFLKSQKNN